MAKEGCRGGDSAVLVVVEVGFGGLAQDFGSGTMAPSSRRVELFYELCVHASDDPKRWSS